MIWLNQLTQGLMLGGYYALLACGLSFMFGVMAWFSFGYFWVTQANASGPQFSAVWRACLAI